MVFTFMVLVYRVHLTITKVFQTSKKYFLWLDVNNFIVPMQFPIFPLKVIMLAE